MLIDWLIALRCINLIDVLHPRSYRRWARDRRSGEWRPNARRRSGTLAQAALYVGDAMAECLLAF